MALAGAAGSPLFAHITIQLALFWPGSSGTNPAGQRTGRAPGGLWPRGPSSYPRNRTMVMDDAPNSSEAAGLPVQGPHRLPAGMADHASPFVPLRLVLKPGGASVE